MFKRIIVGTDFSAGAKVAVDTAYQWAKKWDVPLTVVHIIPPPASPHILNRMGQSWEETLLKESLQDLNQYLKDYPGATPLVKVGSPAETLCESADADTLIVVGSVGHSGPIGHLFFGSTAVKAVKHAPGNVLVVR